MDQLDQKIDAICELISQQVREQFPYLDIKARRELEHMVFQQWLNEQPSL